LRFFAAIAFKIRPWTSISSSSAPAWLARVSPWRCAAQVSNWRWSRRRRQWPLPTIGMAASMPSVPVAPRSCKSGRMETARSRPHCRRARNAHLRRRGKCAVAVFRLRSGRSRTRHDCREPASAIAALAWTGAPAQPRADMPGSVCGPTTAPGRRRTHLASGRTLHARLVVAADGMHSWAREAAGITVEQKSYGQMGVVANFACARPHHNTAFQWFRSDGVLAYLPLPGQRMSIVWSTPDAHAAELLALPPGAFCARVAQAGKDALGELDLLSPRHAFRLPAARGAPGRAAHRLDR